MNHFKTVLACLIATAALSTAVVAAPDREAIEARIHKINPKAKISSITETPVEGMNEILADGTVTYISDDGRYLFHGNLIDLDLRMNLTEQAGAGIRKDLLNQVPASEKIVFSPKDPKYTVRVFTDVSCGYCKKLHNEIQSYLDAGIRVEYLAFPRGGTRSPAFAEMEAIWCSKKPNMAFDLAIAGQEPEHQSCTNPIAKHYDLGDRIGVQGTPAIYSLDGKQLGGYVTAAALLAQLDHMADDANGSANAKAKAAP